MTFERAWVLVFLLLPLGWMVFEWRHSRRPGALILKTLAFLAIILALAEPGRVSGLVMGGLGYHLVDGVEERDARRCE